MEAHLHEEFKLWSFVVLCQSQSRMQGGKAKKNLTWRIKEDSNSWTHFEYFLESISCILYVVSKLGKSEVQHFKRCANWSWNEEVMAIWRQPHQAVRKFRSCEINLSLRKFRSPKPILQLRNELWNHLQAHVCHFTSWNSIFAAANHVAKSPPSCESSCKSSPSCEITNSTCKIKVQTCKMDTSNLWYPPMQSQIFATNSVRFFLKIFCVNFHFLLVISQRYYWDIS